MDSAVLEEQIRGSIILAHALWSPDPGRDYFYSGRRRSSSCHVKPPQKAAKQRNKHKPVFWCISFDLCPARGGGGAAFLRQDSRSQFFHCVPGSHEDADQLPGQGRRWIEMDTTVAWFRRHGCWETFYMFACCSLVEIPT